MGNGCTSAKAVQTSAVSKSGVSNLKIVVVGESLSGKSSVAKRFEKNFFQDSYEPTKTLNIISIVKKVNVPNQKIIAVELWDIPAHEDLDMNKTYFQKADAAIVVMDLSDEDSYHYAGRWKKKIRQHHSSLTLRSSQHSSSQHSDFFPILLLGNKFDLVKEAFLRDQFLNKTGEQVNNNKEFRKMTNGFSSRLQDFNVNAEQRLALERGEPTGDVGHNDMKTNGDVIVNNREIISLDNNRIAETNHDSDCDHKSSVKQEKNHKTSITDGVSHDNVSNNHETDHETPSSIHEPEPKEPSSNPEVDRENVSAKPETDPEKMHVDQEAGEKTPSDRAADQQNGATANPDEEAVASAKTSETVTTNHEEKSKDEKTAKSDEISSDQVTTENNNQKPAVADENETSDESRSDRKKSVVFEAGLHVENDVDTLGEDSAQHDRMEVHGNNTSISDNTDTAAEEKQTFKNDLFVENVEKSNSGRKKSKLKKLFPKDLQEDHEKLIDQISLESPNSPVLDVSLLTPCVEKLEIFAEENGFLAGIPVSAKESKGGVHEAIQSLLRHLLNKGLFHPERKRRNSDDSNRRKRVRKNSGITEEFEALQEVGIIEIDEVLKLCNSPLQTAENITSAYREAIREFKRACYTARLVVEKRINVEECIAALKNAVESPQHAATKSDIRMALLLDNQPKYSLAATDKDGFISLQVVDEDMNEVEDESAIPSNVTEVLQLYHEKVHSICCSVVQKAGELQQQLDHHLSVMGDKEEKAWDLAVAAGKSQAEVRRILTGLAQAVARMRGTLELVRDTRKAVLNLQAKTRAVLLF